MRKETTTFDDDLAAQVLPLEERIGICTRMAVFFIIVGFLVAFVGLAARQDKFSVGWLSALFQGPVAAIWALAGVLLVYAAFQGQRLQLLYQQQDLRTTRAELRSQKEEFEVQNATAKRQRFESTFFQMLSLHHEIVNALGVGDSRDTQRHLTGRRIFTHLWFKLEAAYSVVSEHLEGEMQRGEAAWDFIFRSEQSTLGHYFRNLYHIFKYVKLSEMPDMRRYSSLARAQLSTRELGFLFYNCAVGAGREKFLPLAKEFELFENLPDEELLNEEHGSLLDEPTFGTKWPAGLLLDDSWNGQIAVVQVPQNAPHAQAAPAVPDAVLPPVISDAPVVSETPIPNAIEQPVNVNAADAVWPEAP